jgi:glycosyltransferase involved in cell wall biosynthesis
VSICGLLPFTPPGADDALATRWSLMRVALVSDMYLPRRGGIELHVADLAARLAAAGHAVDVLTPMPDDAPEADTASGAPRVRRLRVPLLPGAAVACTPAVGRALDAALAQGRYDVVHCHASVVSPAAWLGVWAAQRQDIPAVLTFHSVLRASARMLRLAHGTLGCARWPLVVTGVSTLVAEQARRAAPGSPVVVLPNGTEVAWWARSAPRARGAGPGRQAWHAAWPDADETMRSVRELRLVSAMRLTRKKRPAALVRMAAALRDAAPAGVRVRLALAGDGPLRGSLERAVRRQGLADVVRLLGWRQRAELRALYHGADAFVLPTRDESFGIAALEARSAGLPVIARSSTGVADFVRDGRHGYLCASDEEMTARLVALVTEPARLTALATRSHAAPPMAYDWTSVVAQHLAVYAAARDGSMPVALQPMPGTRSAGRRRVAAR